MNARGHEVCKPPSWLWGHVSNVSNVSVENQHVGNVGNVLPQISCNRPVAEFQFPQASADLWAVSATCGIMYGSQKKEIAMDMHAKFNLGLPYKSFLEKYANSGQKDRWRQAFETMSLTASQKQLLSGFKREMKVMGLAEVGGA